MIKKKKDLRIIFYTYVNKDDKEEGYCESLSQN